MTSGPWWAVLLPIGACVVIWAVGAAIYWGGRGAAKPGDDDVRDS